MSDAPSLTKILDRDWSLLIGGRPVPSADGRYYDDESPVTEEVIGFKRSGTGREESLDELLSYTQLKTVNIMLA